MVDFISWLVNVYGSGVASYTHALSEWFLDTLHRRKMSDWSTRDHVTLPNSKWRQYLHSLFIPVERRLIAA